MSSLSISRTMTPVANKPLTILRSMVKNSVAFTYNWSKK